MLRSDLKPTGRGRGERGSVALVVMVIFVMASLAAIMVTRSAGDLRLSVTEQHQAEADAAADIGIGRAQARIQGGESSSTFVDNGSVADATWSVSVRLVDAARWDLISTGRSGSSERRYYAAIVRGSNQVWAVSEWHQLADTTMLPATTTTTAPPTTTTSTTTTTIPVPTGVTFDSWTGTGGTTLNSIATGTLPNDGTETIEQFDAPLDRGNNLGTRLRALVTAPTTGAYTFSVAGDDYSHLLMSTDTDPANRAIIATVPGWSNQYEWDKYPAQTSAVRNLVAGQQYFIEAFSKEAGGGDNLSVAWSGPGIARQLIPGSALAPTLAGCTGWCPTPPFVPSGNGVTFDSWTGVGGGSLSSIATGTLPNDGTSKLTQLDALLNRGDNLGTRLRALVTAPTTGAYTFSVAGDDESTLLLSHNQNPSNRAVIATVPGWSNQYEWDKYPEQTSAVRHLVAGHQYFIEAFAKEAGGGDNLSVAWSGPGIARQLIPGSALAPTLAGCTGWCPT